jgi:hypothetical protein
VVLVLQVLVAAVRQVLLVHPQQLVQLALLVVAQSQVRVVAEAVRDKVEQLLAWSVVLEDFLVVAEAAGGLLGRALVSQVLVELEPMEW